MRIGIISDIHGNIYAFERIVKDLKEESLDYIVFLGDLVFNGLYPQECYDLLKTLNIKYYIKGNTDSNIEEFIDFNPRNEFEQNLYEMIEYTYNEINSECKKEIESWNILEKENIEDNKFLYCHGSPYSFKDKLTPYDRDLERIKDKLEKEESTIIFCGHTHIKEQFEFINKKIINFGAIGYNYDRNGKTRYGIVEVRKKVKFQFKELDYDIEKYETDIRNQKPVFGKDLILLLEYGLKLRNEMNLNCSS